ncbi:hypothetical protein GCM10007304_11740 [Rhodococcoides trifolii]|uniref:DUF385 domain-containing protein n=1 Tax=Rhodococcoides trifolii TaxID=908250 RepID=A0A917CVE3_9NOCA|nr:hypothetical protein [Rhodococcus trifolii]GGF99544.1 hypothetical protein GCM10007304_11740 [Rhodococcus trifolii]
MDFGQVFRTAANGANKVMLPLLRNSPLAGVLNKSMAEVTYTGRKSGKQITLVVSYKRSGDTVRIAVVAPDAKSWWRNFLGDGAPMTLMFDGKPHEAHAIATRSDKGAVRVEAKLLT